jgi:subtilisin-like proprotein convertase family protein
MKQLDLKFLLLFLVIILVSFSSFAQKLDQVWTKTTKERAIKGHQLFRKSVPNKSIFYQLDVEQLKTKLQTASKKESSAKNSNTIVTFPNADGTLESYRVEEASIMAPSFQAEHNNMRTYVGQSIQNPEATIYFSITPKGLHTMTLSSKNGAEFIDPYTSDSNTYIVYNKKDLPLLKGISKCFTPDNYTEIKSKSTSSKSLLNASDGRLRTFRLALASTVEYSTFHINAAGMSGGTDPQKKQAVLDAMIVTMTRVNGIFKRDLSLQMSLVNNDAIIFLAENDGFSNNDASALINQSQTIINAAIGATNYDIGHTFSTGAGGIAELSSPCNNTLKAKGVTGQSSPVGDAYDIDFVAHEMGHQFGAPHTWNGNDGNCDTVEWNSTNAYEPGSGSTIMGYAGICSPQNIQAKADAYFHQKSLQMIWDNITTGSSTCANAGAVLTGNNVPTAEAGANYTIPISTPYKLVGSSGDLETTNTHTFTWEQYDLGNSGTRGIPNESNTSGPLVRSFEGTTDPIRYIPKLEDLRFSNGSTTWEKLTSVSRPINFQLTVRDNDIRGGQTATDNMTVTTNATAGPFEVTSQSSYISYPKESTQTITWEVANTNLSPINTSLVNIYLSIDGGLTFPTLLLANTANDGMENVTFPTGVSAPFCRIMIEAVNNIFFAINTADFALGYTISTICNQYSGGTNLPLNIPDNGSSFVTSSINVSESTTITDVNVGVNISHTYQGDLQLAIVSPQGTQTNIMTPNVCGNGSLIVKFDDSANPISCSNTQSNEVYQPQNPLSIFNGENPSGNWNLAILDLVANDVGTLNSWYLELCTTTITLSNPEPLELADLKVFPNPNKGAFTVTLNNAAANNINIEIFDLSGRKIFNNDYRKTGPFNEEITLSNLQSGMYIMNISDGNKKATRKIIVE